MAETNWHLQGDYFENCNCTVLCPCIHDPRNAPTDGHCDVALAFHIESGRFNETTLDGLNFILAAWTPGVMGDGVGRRLSTLTNEPTIRSAKHLSKSCRATWAARWSGLAA